jgi:hypothetical protein
VTRSSRTVRDGSSSEQIRRVGDSGSVGSTACFSDALPALFLLFTNNTSTHPILPILRLDCNECFRAKLGHLKRQSFRRSTWPLCRSRFILLQSSWCHFLLLLTAGHPNHRPYSRLCLAPICIEQHAVHITYHTTHDRLRSPRPLRGPSTIVKRPGAGHRDETNRRRQTNVEELLA